MFASRAVQQHTQDQTPSRAKQMSQGQTQGLRQLENVPASSPPLHRYLGNNYVQAMSAMDGSSGLPTPSVPLRPSQSGILQRKCACGGAAGMSGECEECSKKQRLGLQTKLKVSEPGDIYEREADRIADQVLATPAHPAVSGAPPRIQRFTGQSTGQMDAAPASVDQALASPGRPLAPALRQDMEQRFGHDFSRVRVHSGSDAEQSAQDVNAHAYTVGHDIVFGAGQFTEATNEGRRLLAHELTHVVQQGAGQRSARRLVQRDSSETDLAASPREISQVNVHRLGVAHLRWTQSQQISAEDLRLFAPVEIVTGHWTLRSERYDMFMAAFDRGPRVIQIDDLPDNAMAFFFVSGDEFRAEHAIRVRNAVARAEACGGGGRPSEIACFDKVREDVAPAEFERKERGYIYMARGMAAGEGAMSGGNPIEMGALVFAHNVLGWSPEKSAAFASTVSGAVSIAGAKYAKIVTERKREPDYSLFVPAGRDPAPNQLNAMPRTPAQLITGQDRTPQVETHAGPIGGGLRMDVREGQTIVDAETLIALDRAAQPGVRPPLTPGEQMIVGHMQGRGVIATPTSVAQFRAAGMRGTVPVTRSVPHTLAERQAILHDLEAAGVGTRGGAADREIVADALLAQTAPNIAPVLATSDSGIINGLFRRSGMDPRRLGGLNVAEYIRYTRGVGVFAVEVQGRVLFVRPLQRVRPRPDR